ncbi:MAG: patatin [Planctomycetaceae bacterium]|nr:patatin [Planctomycetaceae bacterium]
MFDSMRSNTKTISLLLVVLATGINSGCEAPSRRPVPHEHINHADPPGMAGWRFIGDNDSALASELVSDRIDVLRDQMSASGLDQKPINVLAISGGGDNGAYGAGLLQGWSELGTRPEFNAVTGISTGALTAPFAFLGPDYDDRLATCYTTLSTDDLVEERGLIEGLTGDALTEPVGLRALLDQQLDEETFRRIGEEHQRGRRLFIGTTNLDRMEPTYWCISALAAEEIPGGRELACDIILASASIPGVFPPVLIEVVGPDGETYDEMHVDGGVSTQVFTFPVSLKFRDSNMIAEDLKQAPAVWVIRNAPLVLRYQEVDRTLLSIAGRAISGLIRSNGIGDLYRIWLTTRRDGFDFHLASIPFEFDLEAEEPFDPVYMKALFERGRDDILEGRAWRDYPPQMGPSDEESLRIEFTRKSQE